MSPPNDLLSGTLTSAEVESANGGIVETELIITDEYAGDNYQIEARFNSLSDPVQATSGTLTAWKRMYVEHDRMYKVGEFVIKDSGPGSGNADNKVYVRSVGIFGVGNTIHIFSGTNPTGEMATVLAKNTSEKSLTLSINLTSLYPSTVIAGSCDPSNGTFNAYCAKSPYSFVAKVSGGTYDVLPTDTRYDRAFTDPFVEIKVLSSNFLPAWPNINITQLPALGPWIDERTFLYFENKNTTNHVQLVSAGTHQVPPPNPVYGITKSGGSAGTTNTSWVFWKKIKDSFSPHQNALDSVTAHEFAHQWNVNPTYSQQHCNQLAWLPLGIDPYCLMNQSRDRSKGVQLFHIADPSEIWCIRKHADNLFIDPSICP